MSEPITIDGIQFVPVMARETMRSRHVVYRPAVLNGKALYAVPGGLLAYEDDLPRIAKQLRLASTAPSGTFSP